MSLTRKLWVFRSKEVWIMVYEGDMGYHPDFPANQLGGSKKLWVFTGYGLSGIWARRESTVPLCDPPVA